MSLKSTSCTLIPSVFAFDVDAGFESLMAAQRMIDKSAHSWEWGTAAQALLELYSNELSVFALDPFPDGKIPCAGFGAVGLTYAKRFIRLNQQTLCPDTSAGDPASLGVSAILLGQKDPAYLDAAERQAHYLLNMAPRLENGAISHRTEAEECWSDNMAMTFPFLAYQAVQRDEPALMEETFRQCGLYREMLKTPEGYWKHIVGEGDAQDPGAWSTGNGWAVYGMVRILHTLQGWSGSVHMTDEADQLKSWIKEILDGAMISSSDNGLLRNYLDDKDSFGEFAGTALLTAVAYRMVMNDSKLFPQEYIDWAEANRLKLATLQREDGIFSPAVHPYDWRNMRIDPDGSAEGQAFMVLLYTAYRDCVHAGICKPGLSPKHSYR